MTKKTKKENTLASDLEAISKLKLKSVIGKPDIVEKLAKHLYTRFTYPSIHIPWEDMPDKIHDGYKIMALQLLDEIGYKDMYEALKEADNLIKLARQYFPKSMHNPDRFQLENTCATIGKVITKAEGK